MRVSKTFYLLLFIGLIVNVQVFAQSTEFSKADKLYNQFDFAGAAKYYEKAIEKDPTSTVAKSQLASCYWNLNDMTSAEMAYAEVNKDPNAKIEDVFRYAQTLRSNEKYTEAKSVLQNYAKKKPEDPRTRSIVAGIDVINLLEKENPQYDIELAPFNSDASDFGPAISNNEVIFCSNRAGGSMDKWTQRPFLQLFSVEVDTNEVYSDAALYENKAVNGKYHEGPVAFDRRLNDMYISRNNYIKGKPVRDKSNTVNLKIYRLVYVPAESRWGDELVDDFPHNNDDYSCAHPTITKDGKKMFFASNMPHPKAQGGSDIYMCEKTGDIWGEAINLGPAVNTPGADMYPYISDDGTFYFASDGHFGLGGLDMYSTRQLEDGSWDRLANLGTPANSNKDDFGLVLDETAAKGYFVSNRSGGFGDDDIYKFEKKGIKMCGEVYDALSGEKIPNATVSVYKGDELVSQQISGSNGEFCAPVEHQTSYRVVANKKGFFANEMNVDVQNEAPFVRIPLTKDAGIQLEVTILDMKTKQPINVADVNLINDATGREVPSTTNSAGQTIYQLDPETTYTVFAGKKISSTEEQYLNNSTSISTIGKQSPAKLYATIELRKEKKGVGIRIDNIYYDVNKSEIRPDAALELNKLVKILTDNPTMEIELSSHTDCRSTAKYNMWLSAKRAESAVNYIISRGISGARLIAAGYGESRLVNDCACENYSGPGRSCSDDEHQQNRRTEFKILRF